VSQALAFVSAALAVCGLTALAPSGGAGRDGLRARLLVLGVALGRRLRPGAVAPRDLESRIAAAGAPGGLSVREAMALKLGMALAGVFCGVPFGTLLPGRLGIVAIVVSPVAGFMAPDLWLRRRARGRAEAIRRELPAMLDLLRVSVEAGVSLGAALGEVGVGRADRSRESGGRWDANARSACRSASRWPGSCGAPRFRRSRR
jgi:tight adherence protein C